MTDRTESDCRDMRDEGYGCSCHLSPPCGFCVSMTAEEVDAYADGGSAGLDRLWERLDDEAEALRIREVSHD